MSINEQINAVAGRAESAVVKTTKLQRLTEKQFQSRIVAYARLRNWLVYFTWNSMHSPAGFPDVFLLKGTQALAVELKVGTNTTTLAQDKWLAALNEAGIRALVVYPAGEDALYRLLDGQEPVEEAVS